MGRNRKSVSAVAVLCLLASHQHHHVSAMGFFFNCPQVESKEVALLLLLRPKHAKSKLSFIPQEHSPWKLVQAFRPRSAQLGQSVFLENRVIERIESDLHANTFTRQQQLFSRAEDSRSEEQHVRQLLESAPTIGCTQAENDHLKQPLKCCWLIARQ